MSVGGVSEGFLRLARRLGGTRAAVLAIGRIVSPLQRVRARPASEQELISYWPQLTRMWPAYQAFYDKGGRNQEPPVLAGVASPDGHDDP